MEKKKYITPAAKNYAISPAQLCADSFGYHDEEANPTVGAGAKKSTWDLDDEDLGDEE